MEEVIFVNKNNSYKNDLTSSWPEYQYQQIKYQILAYKYMIRNMNVPAEILEKIRTFESEEWEKIREKTVEKVQVTYQKRFENHDLVSQIYFIL